MPLDDALSTEIAWIGPDSARNVLVVISGTHGAEGRVGLAVQLDILARLANMPEDSAMLMVFALNPYGFSYDRRCDAEGIDLNRNFVDFTRNLPVNAGYAELRDSIYLTPAERADRFAGFRAEHGDYAYETAISGGQYCDPDGPFYGGERPAHGNNVIEKLILRFSLENRRVAVIDIHSGLGPYGHGEVICDHQPGSCGANNALQWYGGAVTLPSEGTSSSVPKEGLLDYRWHQLMTSEGCFVTLEFGSYPVEALFNVLLDDHAAWKSGDRKRICCSAAAMREHFCPEDPCWRELVLVKGRQVIQQAIEGLANEGS